jgi:hypothetical protein
MDGNVLGTNKGDSKTLTGNGNPVGGIDGNRNTSTEAPRTDGGNRGNNSSGGNPAGQTEEVKSQGLPKLVEITPPNEAERKKAERREKDRIRYAEKKASGGKASAQAVMPKPVDTMQIEMILLTVFQIVGSRENMKQWTLSPQEAKQIAQPLGNLMSKSEAFKDFGEHSDAIALIIAVAMIFTPKVMTTLDARKEKPKNGKPVLVPVIDKSGKSEKSDKPDNRPPASNGENHGGSIHSIIPTTA